jgi:lysophospholipase L1-like esterase
MKQHSIIARLIAAFFPMLMVFCQHPEPIVPTPDPPVTKEKIDYLALGDSYTKGESVPSAGNFPNQLADSLRANGYDLIANPRIIAQTGWRTDQLKIAITAAAEISDSTFSLVTLLIGVNNQYQNANFDTYKTEFEALLNTAIQRAGGKKERVLVVSIPDWAYTSYGQNFSSNPSNISQKIDQYNAANRAITDTYGVRYVNITEISRNGLNDPTLVANDGLHPSAKQYTELVKLMLPELKAMLQ